MANAIDILENERLAALSCYDILDTPQEEAFDRVTRLACRFFNVPMATITMIDGHRSWFKSQEGGAPGCEVARASAFCTVTITKSDPVVVPDALADERFKGNPFVVGEPHIRFYAGVPLRTPEGNSLGTICLTDVRPRSFEGHDLEILTDLAGIVMSELELRKLATTDSLTGTLSRRAFKEEAERAVHLAIRHRHDVSCIAFDLDHFKAVNDTHGHAVGDRVLIETAGLCKRVLRKTDIFGRLGGEEFAILLPHTGCAAALKVAEKLRETMDDTPIQGRSSQIRVSASFGVVALDRYSADLNVLLHHADDALYTAKAQGRNRCSQWEPVETIDPSLRRRVFKAGQIAFQGGRSTIACTVRSLSDCGATLDVISTAGVPGRFKLHIASDDLSRACRVVTKRDKHIEVAFS